MHPDRTSAPPRRRPRVLVVRLSSFGDVLHALPAVGALRRECPQARVDWVVEDRFASFVDGHPSVDRVVVFPRAFLGEALPRPWRWPSAAARLLRFAGGLLGARYDAALDFQGNLKSGLVTLLAGAASRFGFTPEAVRDGSGVFTNRHVRPDPARPHRVERNLSLVSAYLGRPARYEPTPVATSEADVAAARRAVAGAGLPSRGYAVLHPGTSDFGRFKRWPAERFARLGDELLGSGSVPAVALTFGPGERALAEEVRARMTRPAALVETPSLGALAEVVRGAGRFVSADTGPLHLAAAVGTPLVGLFGPKDERVYGPYGLARGGSDAGPLPVASRDDVPCRPCPLRACPDPVCMSGISVDAVLAASGPAPSARARGG